MISEETPGATMSMEFFTQHIKKVVVRAISERDSGSDQKTPPFPGDRIASSVVSEKGAEKKVPVLTRTPEIEMPTNTTGLGATLVGGIETASVPPSDAMAINVLSGASAMGALTNQAGLGWLNPLHGMQMLQTARKPTPFSGKEGGTGNNLCGSGNHTKEFWSKHAPHNFGTRLSLRHLRVFWTIRP